MLALRRSGSLNNIRHFPVVLGQVGWWQRGSGTYTVGDATNIQWFEGAVPRVEKEARLGQHGCVLWFTGLSGSGKSTVAATLEHALAKAGHATALLDGDNVRHGLNSNLGFSAEDRAENIRRIGEVARLFVQAGLITIVAFISPYRADRQRVRDRLLPGDFLEVFMRTPLDVCESRDPKGLYKKARAGQLKGFTGIDDPYEEPQAPELMLDARNADGTLQSAPTQAATILRWLLSPPNFQLS